MTQPQASVGAIVQDRPEISPAIIRGRVIESDLIEFGGRGDGLSFLAPDPAKIMDLLPIATPRALSDLYTLTTNDIIEYLMALGEALKLENNPRMQRSLELSYANAPTTPPIVLSQYRRVHRAFTRELLEEVVASVGADYLDGWVERTMPDGKIQSIRAFGARALHIVAGNSPFVSAVAIIRNAVTRGDAIIKVPSNDPFTATAIIQTMIDIAPDHPLTKHVSVAYWKGGDEALESRLYRPHNLEKIIAWGGFSSIKHVTKYIQPGLELISLDPKRSISIIGREAFADEETMGQAALRLANDIGALNQEGCANSRVAYVETGTDDDGIEQLEAFGRLVHAKLLTLPTSTSTAPKGGINRDLKAHIQGVQSSDDWYTVVGGEADEGAIIVSKTPEPVDFQMHLTNRVANLVPVDDVADALGFVDSFTQTVGVFPEKVLDDLADGLSIHGAQRLMSLGYAIGGRADGPQDGIEPLRRMCKWIVRERCDPAIVVPTWK